MHVFSPKCWYATFGTSTKMLDIRSCLAMFIGYAKKSDAFKLLYTKSHRVVLSKDVVFEEFAECSLSLEISGGTGSNDN